MPEAKPNQVETTTTGTLHTEPSPTSPATKTAGMSRRGLLKALAAAGAGAAGLLLGAASQFPKQADADGTIPVTSSPDPQKSVEQMFKELWDELNKETPNDKTVSALGAALLRALDGQQREAVVDVGRGEEVLKKAIMMFYMERINNIFLEHQAKGGRLPLGEQERPLLEEIGRLSLRYTDLQQSAATHTIQGTDLPVFLRAMEGMEVMKVVVYPEVVDFNDKTIIILEYLKSGDVRCTVEQGDKNTFVLPKIVAKEHQHDEDSLAKIALVIDRGNNIAMKQKWQEAYNGQEYSIQKGRISLNTNLKTRK